MFAYCFFGISDFKCKFNLATCMLKKLSYKIETDESFPVFSPGRGLAGFPQEKLRWRIKSQEDAPVWAQRQATCQTDFRVGTLE